MADSASGFINAGKPDGSALGHTSFTMIEQYVGVIRTTRTIAAVTPEHPRRRGVFDGSPIALEEAGTSRHRLGPDMQITATLFH
jgi:hypothetical protein